MGMMATLYMGGFRAASQSFLSGDGTVFEAVFKVIVKDIDTHG
jgi:hypothetical protein